MCKLNFSIIVHARCLTGYNSSRMTPPKKTIKRSQRQKKKKKKHQKRQQFPISTILSFKTMQKSTTTVQLNGLHPTALFVTTTGGELCGTLVQALFPLKACEL